MATIKLDLKTCTVGELKKVLANVPDNTIFDICSVGSTGFVDGIEIEINTYESFPTDVAINVGAESGYY